MDEPEFLLFASDATLMGLTGGALLLVALAAMVAERRRQKRKHVDAVGCMPWTTLFFLCFFPGAILMWMALKGWLAG
ncbi:hypothetical protein KK137_07940 [Croceibacterium sp. LX-88]|uniref:Cardiolipin synthase N-terminal domain-containing protein n=1 Tax=Croceibacterium selenioxidans TaxID=2838833 RepID=A0ABS5W3C7_9SPHN|nr:hypothetical protein [Croceibacterium selenioxidans]MBT2134258.1 hypothetical protein [Croceibacterium selenioxidans]